MLIKKKTPECWDYRSLFSESVISVLGKLRQNLEASLCFNSETLSKRKYKTSTLSCTLHIKIGVKWIINLSSWTKTNTFGRQLRASLCFFGFSLLIGYLAYKFQCKGNKADLMRIKHLRSQKIVIKKQSPFTKSKKILASHVY